MKKLSLYITLMKFQILKNKIWGLTGGTNLLKFGGKDGGVETDV